MNIKKMRLNQALFVMWFTGDTTDVAAQKGV